MSREELQFLIKKYRSDRSSFVKTFRGLALFFLLVPGAGGLFMEFYHRLNFPERYQKEDLEDAYFYLTYVLATIVVLLLLGICAVWVYRRGLHQLIKDIKSGYKTIEQTNITRKTNFKGQSFYFYLQSGTKLSIEVSAADYQRYQEGDEINIEYATHSRLYFDYF